jgi:hypothetical protein
MCQGVGYFYFSYDTFWPKGFTTDANFSVSNILGVENSYGADKQDLYSNEDYWCCTDIANILLQFSEAQAAVNVNK